MRSEIGRWEGDGGFEGFVSPARVELRGLTTRRRSIRYLQFLRESHQHYELSYKYVLKRNFEGLLLRPEVVKNVLKLHVFESIVCIGIVLPEDPAHAVNLVLESVKVLQDRENETGFYFWKHVSRGMSCFRDPRMMLTSYR